MPRIILLQNEKSLNQQKTNTYVLACDSFESDLNKIDLAKKLKEQKLDVLSIRTVSLPTKHKKQSLKRGGSRKKNIPRTKKYYVTLAPKQKIDEKFEIVFS